MYFVYLVPMEAKRRFLNPLDLELQMVLMWVLGIESRSSARTASVLNHGTISLAPNLFIFL